MRDAGEGDTHKLISLFVVREERSLLLLLVLDKGLEEDRTVIDHLRMCPSEL